MVGQRLQTEPEPNRLTAVRPNRELSAPYAARSPERAMNKPLTVIFTAIILDAVGIGLIFPILPICWRR